MNKKTPNKNLAREAIIMNKKMPNKKILQEKKLNILNEIQRKRSQINFDSQSARIDLSEIIASSLD